MNPQTVFVLLFFVFTGASLGTMIVRSLRARRRERENANRRVRECLALHEQRRPRENIKYDWRPTRDHLPERPTRVLPGDRDDLPPTPHD